ncbi:hypothetical protein FF38_11473 [Lucilia cuprina]|uniref:Uncharacterized protein n=1 Tax=Lucilia cuprina TaxID=7375 RepID=A0A0L0CNZ4_LUCCU|nr:hypothetical protein FF38_11473 [Lucilia cuprina]
MGTSINNVYNYFKNVVIIWRQIVNIKTWYCIIVITLIKRVIITQGFVRIILPVFGTQRVETPVTGRLPSTRFKTCTKLRSHCFRDKSVSFLNPKLFFPKILSQSPLLSLIELFESLIYVLIPLNVHGQLVRPGFPIWEASASDNSNPMISVCSKMMCIFLKT